MLNVDHEGEVVAITPNVHFSGDDVVKSFSVKLLFKDLPLAVAEDGLVGQMSLFYSKDDALKMPDIEPEFRSTRAVEGVELKAGGATFAGLRVKQGAARIKLREKRLADVTLTVEGQVVSGLDKLHNVLRRRSNIKLLEKSIVAVEQAQAA